MATNAFYTVLSHARGVSKQTLSRVTHEVVQIINNRYFNSVINWPTNQAALNNIPLEFYNKGGCPRVIGCIDGSHIEILRRSKYEEQFVNRHGTHSINCLMVCGPNLQFYFVSARWPGSVNDERI